MNQYTLIITDDQIKNWIEENGYQATTDAVQQIGENLRYRFENASYIIEEAAEDVELISSTEPEATLAKLGISLPTCPSCDHCSENYCYHYDSRLSRSNWSDAIDCSHFYSGGNTLTLCYGPEEDTDTLDLALILEAVSRPDPIDVVNALKKGEKYREMIQDIEDEFEDLEEGEKWRWE